MTDAEINIAIAEWCGWKQPYSKEWEEACSSHPDKGIRQIAIWNKWWLTPSGSLSSITLAPSYTTDLNAVHEAEKKLRNHYIYCEKLADVCLAGMTRSACWSPESIMQVCFATARQRAEALLRTIGRWID